MLLEADLPDDVDALRALVLEQAHELDILKVFRAENERLQAIADSDDRAHVFRSDAAQRSVLIARR
jgi:hypothetical protein